MPDYQIDVAVEPDGSRFPERLASIVGKAEARQDPIEVPLEPKVDRGFTREAQRKTKAALAQLDAELELSPALPKNFRRQVEGLARKALAGGLEVPLAPTLGKSFRRDLQRQVAEATKANPVEIPVEASLGRGFRGQLQREVDGVLKAKPLSVPVQAELAGGFRAKLQKTIREALAARPLEATVDLHVSKRGLPAFTREVAAATAEATRAVSASDAADVRIGADMGGFLAEVATGVAGATRTVSGSDYANVNVGADTTKAKTEIGALRGLLLNLSKLAATALVVGGLATLTAGFAGAVNAAADFDAQLSSLQAVAGLTNAEMVELRQQALDAGAATAFSASEAAEAQTELAKAGASTAQILGGGLDAALSLAAAGGIELGDAATFVAQGLNTFGLSAEDASRVADVLAAAANKSAADIPDIGLALSQVGLVADSFGLSIEDTSGALALFAQNGLLGSDAGTSFKTMLLSLNPKSKEAAQLMDELGFSAYDNQGNFIGLEAVAGELQTALAGMTEEQRNAALQTLFGTDAVRAANLIYKAGPEGIAEWTGAVTDAGFASEVAATKLDNLKGDVEALKGSFETVFITAGSSATSGLRETVQALTGLVNEVGPLIQDVLEPVAELVVQITPDLADLVLAFLPVLTVIGELAGPVIGALVRILTALAPSLADVLEAAKPLGAAVLSVLEAFTPLIPIVADVAVVLIQSLVPAFEAFSDPEFVEALVSLAKSFADLLVQVAPLIPLLVKLAVPVVTLVAKFASFEPLIGAVVAGLVAYKVATAAATLATTLFSTASAGFALNPIGLAVAAIVALGAGVYLAYQKIEPFRNAVDSVGRFFRDTLLPAIVDVGKAVARWFVDLWPKVTAIFEKVWPVAKTLFGIFARIQFGPVLKLAQALGKLFSGDFSGFVDKLKEAVLVIPEALGDLAGLVAPVLANIGEWLVTEGVPLLARKYVELWTAIFRFVLDAYPKAVGFLLELVGKIGSWLLTTAVPAIASKAAELTGAFLGWLVQSIVTLPLKLAEFGLNLLAWIIGVPIWLAYEGGKIGIAFLSWLNDAIAKLPGLLLQVGLKVLGWIAETAPKVGAKALELAGSFLSWVADTVRQLPGKLAEITTTVLTWLGELPGKLIEKVPEIVEAAKSIGSGILEGIGQGISAAVDFVGDVAEAIWTAVKDFVNTNVIDPIRTYEVTIDPPGPGVLYEGQPFGSFPRLAAGGLIEAPTLALVGEAGPELVLPLTDRPRLLELLTQAGLLGTDGALSGALASAVAAPAAGAAAGLPGGSASAGEGAGGLPPAGLTWKNDLEGLKAWVEESVVILTDLGTRIADGSLPPLHAWRDRVADVFAFLTLATLAWADESVRIAGEWASFRLPSATLPALASWRAAVLASVVATTGDANRAFEGGLATMAVLAAVGAGRVVDAMASALSGGTTKVETVVSGYARKLGDGLNPILRAVGKPDLRFAEGGAVPGPDVRADVVPALLMPGEVVIRRASVEQFGLGNLLALNAGQVPKGWNVPRYAEGGEVTGDTVGLNPVFHQRLSLWSSAVGQAYDVGSGYRSMAEQARLYQAYLAGTGNLAAPPGSSMHNFGLAADGPHWSGRNPGAFGLRFPVPGEPWHVEPVEAREWARSGDGTAGGAGVLAGLAPLPQVPGMPFEGAVADVATAVLTYAYEAALAWAGAQVMPGGAPTLTASSFPPNVQRILATIRALESGGNYTADNPTSSAFGAYQFIASTYASLARKFGYSPSDLSAATQDAIAGRYVQEILAANGGNLAAVPATWYVGHVPANQNFVPAGNTLSVAEYVSRWLAKYGSIEGFADGGLVTNDGLYRLAEENRPELVLPMTKPDRVRQLAEEHALDQLLYGDRRGGGRSGPTIEGDVILQVTPPGAADPENYGMALSHRIVPVLAAAFSR